MTTNNNKDFFVELLPCGSFFFGNERTFNTAEKDKYKEEITNYFAESNRYPQQTAILGLLRHTLLSLYGQLGAIISDKQSTIGKFNFDGKHTEPYGYIDSISPSVIAKCNDEKSFEFLLPAPFIKQGEAELIYSEIESESLDNKKKDKTPKIINFDHKDFSTNLLWQNQKNEIEKEEIFYQLTKVGVNKKKEEDAFYKQTLYGLKKGFSFGVWITFSENIDNNKLKAIIMPFGADQGLFKIIFHKDIPSIFNEHVKQTQCIYLTSDAFIDKEFFNDVDFAISEFTDFRYIKSKKENFYQINNKEDDKVTSDKSKKIRLLKRGSVIYSNKPDKITIHLESKTAYRNIGYNYYKFI